MDIIYRRCSIFTHIYFFCAILSLMVFAFPVAGLILAYFGPISLSYTVFIAALMNGTPWILQLLVPLSLLALIISYIFALRKRFLPMAVYIIVDTLLTVLTLLFYLSHWHSEIFFFLFRLPFSFLIMMVFLREVYLIQHYLKAEKRKDDDL